MEIKPPSRVTPELREALGIPNNGTCVEFQLAEGVRNPQTEKLTERLSRFYMLRMITSSPHRELVLATVGSRGEVSSEAQVSYVFPEIEELDHINENLRTDDGAVIRMEGTIGLAKRELAQGEAGYEDREGGLLILDEDEAVLDLTLFGFDDDPSARRISGVLKLSGAGDYIRRKLNEAQPEELLTETRDGFDKNHSFYRLLKSRIQPRLTSIVESLREKRPPPKSTLSERTQEKHKKAFELLNELYKQMMGKTGPVPVVPPSLRIPPAAGIAFVTSHVSIQTGVATPVPLLLNRAMVHPGDEIVCWSDAPEVVVNPAAIQVGEPGDDISKAEVKMLRVKSETPGVTTKLTASWKGVKAEIQVTTTEREVITPLNGIEFERDEYAVRLGSIRHLRLFVDTEKIPFGSEISVSADSSALRLESQHYKVEESCRVAPAVAQVEIVVRGVSLASDVMVTASAQLFVAGTKVSVSRRERQERSGDGIFQDYKFG